MISVVVVDDEVMVCAHLRTILSANPEIEVVAEAHDGSAAVETVLRLQPDVVLLDLQMPGMDGLTAIRALARAGSPSHIVVLTTFDIDSYVIEAMHSGASGFILKTTPPADLVALVGVAARGHTVMSAQATKRLLLPSGRQEDLRRGAQARLDALSSRETDVLRCLAEGLSNADVALRLSISEATVKGYVSRLLGKLGCDNRTQAGLLAHAAGLTTG